FSCGDGDDITDLALAVDDGDLRAVGAFDGDVLAEEVDRFGVGPWGDEDAVAGLGEIDRGLDGGGVSGDGDVRSEGVAADSEDGANGDDACDVHGCSSCVV